MSEQGELYKRLKQAYIDEFAGSGERWYDYFIPPEEQIPPVADEAEDLFFYILDEAAKDIFSAKTSAEFYDKVIKWFGSGEKQP